MHTISKFSKILSATVSLSSFYATSRRLLRSALQSLSNGQDFSAKSASEGGSDDAHVDSRLVQTQYRRLEGTSHKILSAAAI